MSRRVLIKLTLLLSLLAMPKTGHAEEMPKGLLHSILDKAPSSILAVKGDKVFLRSERIHMGDGLLFLETDLGEALPLPGIFSNGRNFYLSGFGKHKPQKIWICANTECQWVHYYKPKRCENCKGDTFIVRWK